jgi:serine phosphatase RsbU (regulator of sigma subunit)
MPTERTGQVVGVALATAWLLLLVVLDLSIPGTVILATLFALAPLVACAVLGAAATAGFAVAATALTVASGYWDHVSGTPQQVVRIVDTVLVGAAAVVVAAVRVRREQRFARMVAIAEVAQRAILPKVPAHAGPAAVTARYVSAAKDAVVGGDLYDCYSSNSHTRFLVGDVRGKGIAGVEQAARVIRAFRQSAATGVDLATVARDMSSYLAGFFDDEEFVTALLVETCDADRLTLVSCGHPLPVLVRRDGGAEFLDLPAGLPLGMGERYDAVTVRWRTGDRLLMYTDGVSEARDAHGEFLPLLTLAPLLRTDTVDEALDALLGAVRRHVPHGDLNDDVAVMLLENIGTQHRPDLERPVEMAAVSG